MNWDGFQREALAELGYRLYRPFDPAQTGAADEAVTAAAPGVAERPAPSRHPLQQALLRAAGLASSGSDAARLCAEWPAPEALRAPAAKRALWPRLRALRARTR